ncbi:hypothetical protein LCGC14_1572650 [marine sediment metagenome]|uniref:Uncharacterized protein n=1 Tax=marine sediment metagenome TaxID=412755 RepID=A0A0F9J5G8_9ZZZZ
MNLNCPNPTHGEYPPVMLIKSRHTLRRGYSKYLCEVQECSCGERIETRVEVATTKRVPA